MTHEATEDLGLAIDLFANGKGPTLLTENKYRHADLGLFSDKEAEQFDKFTGLVQQYLTRRYPPRPLCLAVFGAPGSGKSRLVKQLRNHLKADVASELADLKEINLTQITSVDHLASALDDAKSKAGGMAPFVFFDEFDTKLDGAPWGWLYWFLAPMQDGAFRHDGQRKELKRGVYIFAGGTASSFEEFGRANRDAFAIAKGPDFISRLRGYLDIPGVNADDARSYRRALVLHHLLGPRDQNPPEMQRELLTALLLVDRYKHGARSMEALIELMQPRQPCRLTIEDILDNSLRTMHVDRGPLDARTIGGCIGLSGSDVEDSGHQGVEEVFKTLSKALFRDGATIAFGGHRQGTNLLTEILETAVSQLPKPLVPTGKRLKVIGIPTAQQNGPVEFLPFETAVPLPKVLSGVEPSLTLFRKRHQLALISVAQFAIGGRLDPPGDGDNKRYPGVAEEIMLALAMKHPVYISGKLPGGAQWAGVLLGLGRTWKGPPPEFDQEWLHIPPQAEGFFRPPPLVDLPLTRDDLIRFFRCHALGGPQWVNNGLSADENRELFETTCPKCIVELVLRGLRQCFAAASP
jgi:hypothetical protein